MQEQSLNNKASEYAYQEQVYIHSGFYRGKYANIEYYNEKTGEYKVKIKLTEHNTIIVDTKPEFIRHIKSLMGMLKR
jgi:hypothetical protein